MTYEDEIKKVKKRLPCFFNVCVCTSLIPHTTLRDETFFFSHCQTKMRVLLMNFYH